LYSILTQELQLPLVHRLIYVLQRKKKLPEFPNNEQTGEPLVNPKPVTGLEAIGRGDDRNKLVEFITVAQQALGPDVMAKYLNMDEALRRLAASGSIDTTNLVKTQEQLQQEQAQAQAEQEQMQQQEQMAALMQSGAAAKVADNYTKEGAPYGPQFSAGGTVPNSLPNPVQDPGVPSGPTGGEQA